MNFYVHDVCWLLIWYVVVMMMPYSAVEEAGVELVVVVVDLHFLLLR